MKFKENAIKPGMVIHCPKEKDAKVLLEYLESLGYVWCNGANICAAYSRWHEHCDRTGYQILGDRKGKITNGDVNSYLCKITEFSDLIEPDENLANKANDLANDLDNQRDNEMSAVEVLEWLMKYHGKTEFKECFGQLYAMDILFRLFTAEEILDKIAAYEAAKKVSKPVEVEWETQYTIKSRHPGLQKWEDRVIVTGYENAREMRENSERILKEHINSVVSGTKYPVSDYYVIPLRQCRVKGE